MNVRNFSSQLGVSRSPGQPLCGLRCLLGQSRCSANFTRAPGVPQSHESQTPGLHASKFKPQAFHRLKMVRGRVAEVKGAVGNALASLCRWKQCEWISLFFRVGICPSRLSREYLAEPIASPQRESLNLKPCIRKQFSWSPSP